jgi:putative nucleotidyltransferase with HDIG domain
MTSKDLDLLKQWFSEYTSSFQSPDRTFQKNISVKTEHSIRVYENAGEIAGKLQTGQNDALLAETAALLHDIGRFSQYAKYKTFKDSVSENHGRLGARVLQMERVLQNLPEAEQELIMNTVRFHCSYLIPDFKDHKKNFFLKLIRDSDKLDIWRVFVEYYNTDKSERSSAVGQELPDKPGYTKEVISRLHEKKMATLAKLKTLNDFKLTQLSWVYDLNFGVSFRILLERGYLNEIISKLPRTGEIKKVTEYILDFARQRSDQQD